MFFCVHSIDAYVIVYCYNSREAIDDLIHAHLEYIL